MLLEGQLSNSERGDNLAEKNIFLLIFALVSFLIYAVFINLYSDYQHEQDINSLQSSYSLNDNFTIVNPNSISIPAPLRRYIQFALPDYKVLSTHVKINCSGKYRQNKYEEMKNFEVKSVYNLETGEMVSEWEIERNRFIYNKLSEVFLKDKILYEYSLLGINKKKSIIGDNASSFLQSRMILDAVYFPYYYLGSKMISLETIAENEVAVKFNSGSEVIEFTFHFNKDNSLAAISSSKFDFGNNRVALKANYSDYINFNDMMVPASIVLEIENNFDNYILYESNFDSISYH